MTLLCLRLLLKLEWIIVLVQDPFLIPGDRHQVEIVQIVLHYHSPWNTSFHSRLLQLVDDQSDHIAGGGHDRDVEFDASAFD